MPAFNLPARIRPRGDFGRSVLTLVAGTGFAQVIVIASSPVVTRLYTPANYGVFAVATSILSILITITCLQYEDAVPLPGSDETGANVVALALVSNVVMSAIFLIVLLVVGPPVLTSFNAAGLVPLLPLITLGQLGGGTVSALTNWAVRTREFRDIAATRFTQAGALVVVQVGLGLAGLGSAGLLLGDVAGRVSGSTRLARGAWRTHSAAFRSISWNGIRAAAIRYRRFPMLSTPSAVLNTLGFQLPVLAVVALFGTSVGGHYALADRICSIPLALIAGAVGQVFLSEAARNARDEPRAVRSLFLRTTRTLALVAIGPTILGAILAPLLAGPVFGANWAETGLFVAILAPMYFTAFVTTATGEVLFVLERLDLQLVREVIRLVFIGGSVPLAGVLHLSPTGAMALLSAAGCLNYVLYGWISWVAIGAAPHRPLPVHPGGSSDRSPLAVPDPGPEGAAPDRS